MSIDTFYNSKQQSRSSGFDFVPTREEIIKDFAERATRSQKYLGELEAQQKYFRNLMNEYPEIGAVYERLCSDLEKWVIIDNAVVYIDDEEDTPAVSTCRGR
ncbi:MAG: hypothetical protein E7493_12710 [Ruminococcus albus]|nr:hypothetical protein [Ruminococcus albus]